MAIGRFSVGVGAKGKASPHAQYIAREGKYEKDPTVEKLEATGCGNMPKWAQADPNFFWKMSDDKERKNGTSYREHVIALPRELSIEQRHDLVKDWIEKEIGNKHAYQYAIHNPPALDGKDQPHVHLMFSERLIDNIARDPDQYFKRYNAKKPEMGGAKKSNTPKLVAERKLELKAQRDRWERTCNDHLELAGFDVRISMKSLKAQGIDRDPIDIPMIQINKPIIKQAYKEMLIAKNDLSEFFGSKYGITKELKQQNSQNHQRIYDLLTLAEKHDHYGDLADKHYAQQAAERAAQERLAQQAAERAAQERLAQQAAERAAQERLAQQAAERAAQERLAQQAAERAAQERLAQQAAERAAQERLAQQAAEKQELERISKRPMRELLRLDFRVVIKSEYGSILRDTVARVSDDFYDMYKQAKREKWQIGIGNKYKDGTLTNPEILGNATARGIERFMIRRENLSNIDVLSDFESNMSVQDFTKKYSLECDLSDLKRLDELYPVETKKSNLSEPGPNNDKRNDNDHGFSM